MATAQFALTEGTLNVPDTYQDRSINVLKFKENNATLVITRAWDIEPGDEENFLNQQLAKVKRSMRKVVMDAIEDSRVAGQPAREVSLRFENQSTMVYEKLAVTRIDDHLLVLTLSRTLPFDTDADAFWAAIKTGFQLGA
ncbi:DcrB-related protein [Enterobacter sp. Bisph1]|uniref:DcrB-related protein n=1 Tax=Enterobacter sp. Bisph1 TaxID=1274399 RepID=UPI00057BE6B7|nr:DcrB-related protein [Enterobacter sp. Bisph1]